ncbi:calcium-binding protein [Paracoccus sp. JM45]|uniref:calcium-binding protein n=1 Tax=Paracoccus sp. JM45 TaxID=2283626 RepID=UPI000E6BBADB|nr:calcium-binding protein [Paracoccus sp. JM45]RJE80903.1 hypothetical protein DWB67_04705 [Paracoccus sp. JM45]
MAKFVVDSAFDQTLVDLSVISRYFYDVSYLDDIAFDYQGTQIEDVFLIEIYDGFYSSTVILGGSDFHLTSDGVTVDGNLQMIDVATQGAYGDVQKWKLSSIDVPLRSFIMATETYGQSDDRQVFERIFRGNDLFQLSSGNDHAIGMNGNDTLNGYMGNDTLEGGRGADRLYGNAGNDVLVLDVGDDVLNGGAGRDWLRVEGNKAVQIDLSDSGVQNTRLGMDQIIGIENMTGAAGSDTLTGNSAVNSIFGNNGHDRIFGRGQSDLLDGGNGNDRIEGNLGNDTLFGGNGADTLLGGVGNDSLYLDRGNDLINGGSGEDRLVVTDSTDVRIDLGLSRAQNTLQGMDTIRNIENIRSGGGDDRLSGNNVANLIDGGAGHDVIFGRQGDDRLEGKAGQDQLNGGFGNDTLIGGTGKDVLQGGAGADVFVFANLDHTGRNYQSADQIIDFRSGTDLINLRGIDADHNSNGNDAFVFTEGGQFQTAEAGQIIIRQFANARDGQGETRVLMDVDGDGQMDGIIRLAGMHDLGASDFYL